MIREISYKDHAEWLAIRKNYIGGSDAGAVVGLDEYKSPYSLWAEKTGRVPEFEGNVTTRVGAYLEKLVAEMFTEETGKTVRRKNRMLVNDAYPFACADLDRVIVGEKALLECKTTNSFPVMRKVRGGDYPERWYCQMMHYLAVTGYDRAYLAVLVNCWEFLTFTLERDEAEIAALMDAEGRFWELVKNDTPPVVDGSEATADALETVYRESRPEQIDLFGLDETLNEYFALKRQQKSIDERIRVRESEIKSYMQDAERAAVGRYTVSWKTQTRSTFQHKEFAKGHPEIDLTGYYKTTTSRPFKVTAKEEI